MSLWKWPTLDFQSLGTGKTKCSNGHWEWWREDHCYFHSCLLRHSYSFYCKEQYIMALGISIIPHSEWKYLILLGVSSSWHLSCFIRLTVLGQWIWWLTMVTCTLLQHFCYTGSVVWEYYRYHVDWSDTWYIFK